MCEGVEAPIVPADEGMQMDIWCLELGAGASETRSLVMEISDFK
jgi:hypothetical protein